MSLVDELRGLVRGRDQGLHVLLNGAHVTDNIHLNGHGACGLGQYERDSGNRFGDRVEACPPTMAVDYLPFLSADPA